VILLIGALLRNINLLVAIFALMLAAFIWHWRAGVVSLRRLTLRRRSPRQAAAGEAITVELLANNGRRRRASWAVVVEDTIRREDSSEPPLAVRVVFSRVGPRDDATQTYQGQLARRGRYTFGPLIASTRFPMGLVRHTVLLQAPQSLIVVPRQGRLSARWRQWEQQSLQGDRSVSHRVGTAEGDFHSLRPYRSGDKRHLIHWRTSARQGRLMVRQFERPQAHDLAIFLDLWQPAKTDVAHEAAAHQETVELAVSLAATIIAERCHRNGSRLLLGVSGVKPALVRGAASLALLADAMQALAVAEASASDGLTELLSQGFEQTPANPEAVLISTRPSSFDYPARLASIGADARKRAMLQRMLVIDAGGREIFDYFEP
jgi:uncharacterized protein (DUF58 family)